MEIRISIVTVGNDGEYISKRGAKLAFTEEMLSSLTPETISSESRKVGELVHRSVRAEIEEAIRQPEYLPKLDTVPEAGALPFVRTRAVEW